MKAARPFPVGQERSRPPEAGYSLPRSRSPIKETRRGKATVRAPEAAHCSHAYLDKALVIRGEATVSSRRQDPRRWGRPVDQVAGSRRDPPAGGTQQPAEKPASIDTDGWDQIPAGLPLYPRGVGLYKPPGAPMQRVGTSACLASKHSTRTHTIDREKQELALFFFSLEPNSSRSDCSYLSLI